MAVEGKLTGWIELVSMTALVRLDEVQAVLKKLAEDDKNLEIVKLEGAHGGLAHADFTCWDDPAPNFAALFKPIVELLEPQEYLYFEEKVKSGHRGRTLRAILVTGVGIFKAEQDAMILLLQERNIAMDDEEEDDPSDEDDDDTDHGIDVDDDPVEDLDREHNPEPDVPDCER